MTRPTQLLANTRSRAADYIRSVDDEQRAVAPTLPPASMPSDHTTEMQPMPPATPAETLPAEACQWNRLRRRPKRRPTICSVLRLRKPLRRPSKKPRPRLRSQVLRLAAMTCSEPPNLRPIRPRLRLPKPPRYPLAATTCLDRRAEKRPRRGTAPTEEAAASGR